MIAVTAHWCELHVFTRRVLPALPDDPPPQISTQRKPYYSFVALSVLLDYIVRRYIEFVENERRESLQDQVDDVLNSGGEIDA